MKYPVLTLLLASQQVEPPGGAAQHVADVPGVENYALTFAPASGGINDRDRVGIGELDCCRCLRLCRKDLFKEILVLCFRPRLDDSPTKAVISATDERRRRVLHHGYKLHRSLAGIKRNDDQPFRHHSQVHGHPADAVMGHESAAVAFLQTACGEEAAGLADKFQEFTTCDRDGPAVTNFP